LTWGALNRQVWAWWGALVYFGLATLSTILTFVRLSWPDILAVMQFAPTEIEALDGIPASGLHIAAFIGLPLVGTVIAIIYSKHFFLA
jgi:hypothetical protein